MRRLLIILVVLLCGVGAALGQKSYVNVVADHIYSSIYQEIYLTGDVPAGIKTHYDGYGSSAMTIGALLNLLAEEGFSIEQMSCAAEGEVIILSRPSSSGTDQVPRILADDQDAVEVARYNLQGLPVSRDEKGVQIVVYSNYTTRTVIVE